MKFVGGIIENLKKGEAAPGRHHNPYLAEALELGDVLFTQNEILERNALVFSDNSKNQVLEIGCYMGRNVIEMALLNPEQNFLGLDITYKRVVKSAKRIKLNNITNARIGICDARVYVNSLANNTLAGVCIFFPDPWPKKKQLKNRILNAEFIEMLRQKLKNDGYLWFKTDSESYFESVLQNINATEWKTSAPDAIPNALKVTNSEQYITSFEQMFLAKGVPIWRRVFYPVK